MIRSDAVHCPHIESAAGQLLANDGILGRIDERLRELGLTPRAASLRTGRGPDVVRNIRRAAAAGETYNPRTDTIQLLAQALETTPEWLLSRAGERNGVYKPPPEFFGARDLPVFAAVEGGPGEMVVSTDAIEFVPRPWFLAHVREGYAVIVTGESMSPVYEPGDMVLVNPKLAPLKGKNAIFVAGEEHGEFRATVKRLTGSTDADWLVKQWNKPREFNLSRAVWPRALRIVGKYEG